MALPGGKGPQSPLKFVVDSGPFAEGSGLPTGPVLPTITGAPQDADLSIDGWHRGTSLLKQGILGAVILLAPQFDPSLQLQAKVFPSARTAPVTGSFVSAPQQQYVDSTARLSPVAVAGSKPASSQNAFGAPQFVDLTLQGFVQSSARTPPVVSSAAKVVFGSQENLDLGIEGWSRAPSLLNQGIVPPFTRTDPQPDSTQIAKVFAASTTPPVTSGNLGSYLRAAPEQIDLGIEAWHRHPAERHVLVVTTGLVPQSILAQPQADTSQIAASIWTSAVTPSGSTNSAEYRWGGHAIATHLAEAQKSDLWLSVRTPPATLTGPVPPLVLAPPQADSSQRAAIVQPSLRTPPAITPNPIAASFFVPPQIDPTQLAARIFPSVATPPTILTGFVRPMVLVAPQTPPQLGATAWASAVSPQGSSPSAEYRFGGHALALYGAEGRKSWLLQAAPTPPPTQPSIRAVPPTPPQADTSVNPSVVWTPSTFSPSGQPLPVVAGITAPVGHPVYVKGKRKKPRVYETANEQLKKILASITVEVVAPDSKSTDAPILVKAISGKPVQPASSAEAPVGVMPTEEEQAALRAFEEDEEDIIAYMANRLV